MAIKPRLEKQFWSFVSKDKASGCWIWSGRVTSQGFPVLLDGAARPTAARVAWELEHGEVPSTRHKVRRTCRNRACVSPHPGHASIVSLNDAMRGDTTQTEGSRPPSRS